MRITWHEAITKVTFQVFENFKMHDNFTEF